jgi:hypothetical protein
VSPRSSRWVLFLVELTFDSLTLAQSAPPESYTGEPPRDEAPSHFSKFRHARAVALASTPVWRRGSCPKPGDALRATRRRAQ